MSTCFEFCQRLSARKLDEDVDTPQGVGEELVEQLGVAPGEPQFFDFEPADWRIDREKLKAEVRAIGENVRLVVGVAQFTHDDDKCTCGDPDCIGTKGATGRIGPLHTIQLDPRLSAEEASSTLWHELQHVRQAVEQGDRHNQIYALGDLLFGYGGNPLEIDARLASEAHADDPIVHPKLPVPRPDDRLLRALEAGA